MKQRHGLILSDNNLSAKIILKEESMQYRTDKISGNKLSALGLGCMRFPLDKSETERMILAAIEGGVNFFDTAYIYPNSEKTLGNILAKHNKRKDIFLATKLPFSKCRSSADFDRIFTEQLRRLQTDFIDYYFLHSMTGFAQWEKYKEMGIEDWIVEKKASGQIKQIGFSYHGTCDGFLKIIDDYPWEFCMIQYNYSDIHYQAGVSGLKAAADKGMPVIIMEPLLGGRLATGLPKQAVKFFAEHTEDRLPAEWALRWLWNQEEVTVVLSGMSSTQIMNSNLQSVDRFTEPLTASELAVYDKVVAELKKAYKINCTGCNYCLPCPKGINIPGCFSAYNNSFSQNFFTGIMLYGTSTSVASASPTSPRLCNECGACEKECPQNLEIRKDLKAVTKRFESLPLRAGFAIARKVMTRK